MLRSSNSVEGKAKAALKAEKDAKKRQWAMFGRKWGRTVSRCDRAVVEHGFAGAQYIPISPDH
eukprot:COSAG02_NODE_6961_length_3261_cov_10.540164_4_plen_63_part_00